MITSFTLFSGPKNGPQVVMKENRKFVDKGLLVLFELILNLWWENVLIEHVQYQSDIYHARFSFKINRNAIYNANE